jgi:hypothetical protein
MSQPKKKSVIVWTECQVNPKWKVWTGRVGEVDCFSIEPFGDSLSREFCLDSDILPFPGPPVISRRPFFLGKKLVQRSIIWA